MIVLMLFLGLPALSCKAGFSVPENVPEYTPCPWCCMLSMMAPDFLGGAGGGVSSRGSWNCCFASDDASDNSFNFLDKFLLASARALLSKTGRESIPTVCGTGEGDDDDDGVDAVCGVCLNASSDAPVGVDDDGKASGVADAVVGDDGKFDVDVAGMGVVVDNEGNEVNVSWVLVAVLEQSLTPVFNVPVLSPVVARDVVLDLATLLVDVLVLDPFLGGVVESWSCTNIMWSPSLIANVSGDLPPRKSLTCPSDKFSNAFNTVCSGL